MDRRTFQIFALIVREMLSRKQIRRRPEPSLLMESHQNVESFHAEGATGGYLIPIYHFNAIATSHLVPPSGTIVDLGSGSGQYLGYLAQCRPDVRIFGIDLSENMVEWGNRLLMDSGLNDRVTLRYGDMTDFRDRIPPVVDVVSSVFALHHLRATEDLQRCLREIAYVRSQTNCGVWLFDHVRPRQPRTLDDFPELFTPSASSIFKQDSRNSLAAAFSFNDLLDFAGKPLAGLHHECSRLLRLYQAHWIQHRSRFPHQGHDLWVQPFLPASALREYSRFRRLFHSLPDEVDA